MFGMIRRIQKLMLPADGVDPETIDGLGDKTALDTGGEFFGDSDGTGKAFWPGVCSFESYCVSIFLTKYNLPISNQYDIRKHCLVLI